MAIFADYAQYYNLLYANKNYEAEAAFVLELLQARGSSPKTLLDLGCGTGRHAVAFSQKGITVTGVDLSAEMVRIAKKTATDSKLQGPLPLFVQGNAGTVRLGERFDCAVSLFHVMSYQTTEEAALDVMKTARCHLCQGGFFLFDFWYGPGVLADPPTPRERKLENASMTVLRKAEPVHDIINNAITVNYSITVINKITGQKHTHLEKHSLRYWFLPELRYMAKQHGFSICAEGAWPIHQFASPTPWYAWILLRLETEH